MYLTHPLLAGLPHVRHGFFTRLGGVSQGVYDSLNSGLGSADPRANVLENRARIALALGGPPENLCVAHQVHSADALEVTAPFEGVPPRADGLVTSDPRLLLGASHADCAPILFADRERPVIAACHAGWRGALAGITEATLARMEEKGARRGHIVAVIGPTISQPAYEVGPEFIATFEAQSADNRRFFSQGRRAGYAQFDLAAYLLARLQAAGIGSAASGGWCTYSDEARFFSFRRMTHRGEADFGRHLAVIRLNG